MRAPQILAVTIPGHESLTIFNYHAPQGGGSMPGFSGREASQGHAIVSRVIKDDTAPNKMIVGDQNADRNSFKALYDDQTIISVGRDDLLIHAAIDAGLNPEKIGLGDSGSAFKDKGQTGCSYHAPLCFKITLPEASPI
jgi:hypothetical protein